MEKSQSEEMKGDPLDAEGDAARMSSYSYTHGYSQSSSAGTGLFHQFTQCHGSRSHLSFVFVLDGGATQCLTHAGKSSATEMFSQVSKGYFAF